MSSASTTIMIESHAESSTTDDKHPVDFTPEILRVHLEPVIHKMIACEDSHPFLQPVDPIALNILDYSTIIKHPMDISTIHNKLLSGEYKTPLEFCNDAWLMFNNAWIYNKTSTRVYKMCTKLSKVFSETIDPIMQTLGYCCGRQYVYLPQVMFCYGNQLCCQIPRDGTYYYYDNLEPSRLNLSCDKYTFCSKCFDSVKGDSIFLGDDPTQTLVEIPKHLFLPAKNDIQELEPMVDCIVCTRRWHQICALHWDQIWPEGFICDTCIREYNIKRKRNRYIASELTITDLARVLEIRVNDFLRYEGCITGRVTIRVLAASDKVCEIKSHLKNHYPNQVLDGYPYRRKAIFAFQEINGIDVVLFGMYVQEYGEHCQAPNRRHVYISFVNSIDFFQPEIHRTDIYQEIIIGYLDYIKQLGYIYAHIWACAPNESDDYIFHSHPPTQRVQKPKTFQDWFKKMLDRAVLERVVIDYLDIMQYCHKNQIQNVLDIPYFEDDFWPNIIEEAIKKLEQDENNRKKEEIQAMNDVDLTESEDPTEITTKRKSKNICERNTKKQQTLSCGDLMSNIFLTMEKYKEEFFVIRLRNPIATVPAINDPDPLLESNVMDTREAFLNFARNKHYEFSSLRRAKFSTMTLLYELHTHEMKRSNPLLVEDRNQNASNSQLQRQQSMQRCIERLLHAVNCRNAPCINPSCFRYKRVIQHTKECKGKSSQCNVCKQVIFICWYHTKSCIDQNCQVPFCTNLKTKIQKQRATSLQADRRRMQAML